MRTAVKVAYDRFIVLPEGALGMNVVEALENAYLVTMSSYGSDDNFKRITEEELHIGFYPDSKFPEEDTDYKAQLATAKKELAKAHSKQYALNRTLDEQKKATAELEAKVNRLLPPPPIDEEDPGLGTEATE